MSLTLLLARYFDCKLMALSGIRYIGLINFKEVSMKPNFSVGPPTFGPPTFNHQPGSPPTLVNPHLPAWAKKGGPQLLTRILGGGK